METEESKPDEKKEEGKQEEKKEAAEEPMSTDKMDTETSEAKEVGVVSRGFTLKTNRSRRKRSKTPWLRILTPCRRSSSPGKSSSSPVSFSNRLDSRFSVLSDYNRISARRVDGARYQNL